MRKSAVLILLGATCLSACAQYSSKPSVVAAPAAPVASADLPPVVLPERVTAVGYGAMPTMDGLSPEQRRILAMRASKLDAYRSLAEMVDGLKLTGSSTVSAVALTNDSFRVYIEAYVRGARVMSTTPLPGGSYETVVELQLGGEFYRDALAASKGVRVNPSVNKPVPQVRPIESAPEEKPVAAPASAIEVKPIASAASSSNFYLSK